MNRGSIKEGKLLYHLTSIEHLDSILTQGLLPRNTLTSKIVFDDIADKQIIRERDMLGLGNYIPFHFHPYSSFDVAVKTAYPEKEFIYICIERELARAKDFKILINHPLSGASLLEYDTGLERIDQWKCRQSTKGTASIYPASI